MRVVGVLAAVVVLCASPASADIVSIKPTALGIDEQVRLRTDTRIHGRVRVDFGRKGKVVRVPAPAKRRTVRAVVPETVGTLMHGPTRFKVRIVQGATPGRWATQRLLVRPRSAPAPAPTETPASPPSDPAPVPTTPSPTPSPAKRLLTAADFTYLGAFAMPEMACGWTTAWSTTGLALRRVDGQLRFFGGTHVYSGGLIYETDFPGTSMQDWPVANVTHEWCDVYQGHKRTGADAQPLGDDNQTVGLMFDPDSQRLYWSFGQFYNGDHSNDNALGYTTFDGTPTAHGPWSATVHSQKIRGGTLLIPRAFANAYLGGRRLGLGFGGYFNIVGDGSMGPALFAVGEPVADSLLEPVTLMDHPASVSNAQQWTQRPANYWIDGIDWAVSPVDGVGRWAPGDTVNGAAVWIDEADVHGLLVAAQLQTGRIWYAGGGLHAQGDQGYWYVYDPAVLAEVAQGQRTPDSVVPTEIAAVSYPTTGPFGVGDFTMAQRISGMAYDSPSRTLFLLQLNARSTGGEWTPLVHAYRLR